MMFKWASKDEEPTITIVYNDGEEFVRVSMTEEELFRRVLGNQEFNRRVSLAKEKQRMRL